MLLFILLFCGVASAAERSQYNQALKLYRSGDHQAVIDLLAGKLEKDAGESNLLGWSYLRLGEVPGAIEQFRNSIRLNPKAWDSYCGLGYAHTRNGDFEKAAEAFGKGAAGSVQDTDCHLGLARSLENIGRVDEAIEAYRRILAIDPSHSVANSRLEILASSRLLPEFNKPVEYFVRGGYFWMKEGGADPELFYVKGVNVSFATPGKHVTGFPYDEKLYLEWFKQIKEMNANLIRVYTILPPAFYRALWRFNLNKPLQDRLLFIQGIWGTLPEDHDFRNPEFQARIQKEIRDAVNVVHGNADIPHSYGHAYGAYRADVSNYLLAWIFGREWEPGAVAAYNETGPGGDWQGRYLGIRDANPTERWQAEMLDYLVGEEQDGYGRQRPVAWMSWPPLDPLYHPSEATYNESLVFRKASGEHVGEPLPPHKIFDDDAVSLDETKLTTTGSCRGGVFASSHVYPYYPDFLRNDARYAEDPKGHYHAYLAHLKEYYGEMSLLVSEYGVPTSRGIARFHPEGLSHGGHNEQQHAECMKRMTADIRDTGCAGGIVFSWIDEWLKKNWMVAGTEFGDRRWYNAMDPEESYGLQAMIPEKTGLVGGGPQAWAGSTVLYDRGSEGDLRKLQVDHDTGYLYLRLKIGDEVDWAKKAYILAIDTYGDDEGDHRLPFGLDHHSPVGFEFAVVVHGDSTKILVDDRYNRVLFDPGRSEIPGLSGYAVTEQFKLENNSDGRFTEHILPHVRKFGRDGKVFEERIHDAGKLRHGKVSDDSLADWYYDRASGSIEIRIPWYLLYTSDPSRREILYSAGRRIVTDGFRFRAFSYRPKSATDSTAASGVLDSLPSSADKMVRYEWEGWDDPGYEAHLKKAYYALAEQFSSLEGPDFTIKIPQQYDFAQVIIGHYNSMDEFLNKPEVVDLQAKEGVNLYGLAMANMVAGFARSSPFHILEASRLLEIVARTDQDQRVRDAARQGIDYTRSILRKGVPSPIRDIAAQKEPQPVSIEHVPRPPRKFKKIVIGRTAIELQDGALVKTQVDRVTRDWLIARNFTAAPWELVPDRVVPWHEGDRIRELLGYIDARVVPVWGTPARRFGDAWYTPDADGVYRFKVTLDKVISYPTNFIIDRDNVVINDTHGISALAWDSLGADLVIGCGDFTGKSEAAYYLARRGVNVYMPTDRFTSLLIGAKTEGAIVGSGPIRQVEGGVVIGGQPIEIDPKETIVVSTTKGRYPMQYYDTPHRYFTALAEYTGRELKIVPVEVPEYGKVQVVVDEARRLGASLIGVRVWGREEHDAVAQWLTEDRTRRAVLFHTAVYPEGYRLFAEFPEQTSFGDIRPQFE